MTEEDHLIWMSADDMRNVLSRKPESLVAPAQVAPLRTPLTSVGSLA